MRVEALLYPPTSNGFRLDYSRLNKAKLDASAEETSFRLNYHRLDDWINGTYPWDVGIRLGGLPPVRTLQDVAGRTLIGVKWHRGFSRDGLGFSGAVGLMELTFKDGGDPDQYPGLAAGTPVVLWTEDDGESVFQGRFESAEMHPRKDGGFDCVWLIADPVRALTRTKVGPFPEQSWDERAWAIGALPSYNGDLGFSGRIAATNLVATKAEHLDMLAQSTMGAWYVGASFDAEAGVGNQQPFFDVPYREADGLPPRVLSDVSPTSYTEVTAGWGSGTVNDLTLANRVADPTAPTNDTTTPYRAVDSTSAATYGPRPLEVDTNLVPVDAARLAPAMLGQLADRPVTVDAVTVRAESLQNVIGVGQPIDITVHGKRDTGIVATVSGELTPTRDTPNGYVAVITYEITGRYQPL